MRISSRFIASILFFSAALAASNASAQEAFVDEIRLGVFDHDTDLIGHKKESGADVVLELLSRPLTGLNFIGAPRLLIGGAVNSAGQTNQIYAGLIKSWYLVRDVLKSGDGIFIEGVLGGGLNDGKTDVIGTPKERDWKSHGSHFMFRTGFDIGYRIDSVWAVAINFNHISNAGLADPNEGMNGIGLTVNMKLGAG
jgi:lipid A 3-O-deacylase